MLQSWEHHTLGVAQASCLMGRGQALPKVQKCSFLVQILRGRETEQDSVRSFEISC